MNFLFILIFNSAEQRKKSSIEIVRVKLGHLCVAQGEIISLQWIVLGDLPMIFQSGNIFQEQRNPFQARSAMRFWCVPVLNVIMTGIGFGQSLRRGLKRL